jgi:hypothetical protein
MCPVPLLPLTFPWNTPWKYNTPFSQPCAMCLYCHGQFHRTLHENKILLLANQVPCASIAIDCSMKPSMDIQYVLLLAKHVPCASCPVPLLPLNVLWKPPWTYNTPFSQPCAMCLYCHWHFNDILHANIVFLLAKHVPVSLLPLTFPWNTPWKYNLPFRACLESTICGLLGSCLTTKQSWIEWLYIGVSNLILIMD